MNAPYDIDATALLFDSCAEWKERELAFFAQRFGRCDCRDAYVADRAVIFCTCGMTGRLEAARAALREAANG